MSCVWREGRIKMKAIFLITALVALTLAMAGCGGGGGTDPLDIFGTAALTSSDPTNNDGSLYDERYFTATRNGYIAVSMSSDDLDAYVVVYEGRNEETRVGTDDDSGPGTNALLYFYARKGWVYTAKFTTSEAEAITGDYIYTIAEVDGSRGLAAQVSDSPAKAPIAATAKDKATK